MIDPDLLASRLWNLVTEFERADEDAHRYYFNEALKSELYWSNRQKVFLDRNFYKPFLDERENDDYIVNIYRPNGESIIAAMAAAVPKVDFYPDDAENPDDLVTAEAYKKISVLIQKHNKAHLLAIRVLFTLYNQHFAAIYNFSQKSVAFGTWKRPEYGEVEKVIQEQVCPYCKFPVVDFSPPHTCVNCNSEFDAPSIVERKEIVREIVGYTDEPKSREILKVFGPLHVRIAPYVQDQADTPYLILEFEQHHSLARKLYPDYADKIGPSKVGSNEFSQQRATLYQGQTEGLDCWKMVWLRTWAYEMLPDKDEVYQHLVELYPNGVKLVFVNDVLVEIANEDLDDHWTISSSPLSTYIYSEPIGKPCIPIQDATNELVNLSMDTIKHGIPQTFADPDSLDFEKYEKAEIAPGMVFPMKVPSGKSISDVLHTTRTAVLSKEVESIADRLQQFGQFVTGAFPSIYGGILQGSRTASEYAQSRAQALQRLANTWNVVKQLWADAMSKAVVSFARNLKYDERQVIKTDNGFINVWIRQSELNGRVGSVEPEVDEQLPVTWAQQRDVLLRLIELNSPDINQVLADPENSHIIRNGLGLKDIKLPGYDDRLKQLREIQDIIAGKEVQVDPLLDNHIVESDICRSFLISESGRDLKQTNPEVYNAILQHYKTHMLVMLQSQQGAENVRRDAGPVSRPRSAASRGDGAGTGTGVGGRGIEDDGTGIRII